MLQLLLLQLQLLMGVISLAHCFHFAAAGTW
jgi:hypothetical protein